jgi:lipoic acid synthetase
MNKRRHPDWLKVPLRGGQEFSDMKKLLRKAKLNTICEEAKCPNITECFNNGTAVFLILGDICTRNCKYCNVKKGKPNSINSDEPREVAKSVKLLGLKYVVITSVTRDDLYDGGADLFNKTVKEIKYYSNKCKIELLIPDFNGNVNSLNKIIKSKPDVINHNIEVCKRLFPIIRPNGDYDLSLSILEYIKKIDKKIKTKSGFMIGLGERENEIIDTMKDLNERNVDYLTIGQYLQPTLKHAKIVKYYNPEEFNKYKKIGENLGFKHIESGPLVRSSYHAERALNYNKMKK